jgi:hypothetical protein
MRFELFPEGGPPRVLTETLPCRYKYEGAARIAAATVLNERYGATASLREVAREDFA